MAAIEIREVEGGYMPGTQPSTPDQSILDIGGLRPPARDNIDLSQARVTLNRLQDIPEETTVLGEDTRPIWLRENGERFASSPGLDMYVVWRYIPGEEGVLKFNRFDNLDPLPHHYYKSQEEFEKARKTYQSGVDPDQTIYVHTFSTTVSPSQLTSVEPRLSTEPVTKAA